ncbi:MAG: tRNA 2-thiouridine(34) synthase MnmA [Oligoflexales bacterium]
MSKRVVVGMSGGVDSSVAALLLKQQGYEVVGLFMKNWDERDDNGVCTSAQDYESAQRTCDVLDIPLQAIEFTKEYQEFVFKEFLSDYKSGFTPNPDILCNREIKFKVFYEKALSLGASYLATGHYCQTDQKLLIKGKDPLKDQSYFLCGIHGKVLNHVLFPIGNMEKSAVRELAHKHNLPVWNRKDSTGICFIGERNFREFLSSYIPANPGEFQTLDGTKVGQHHGSAFYTLGQRKGLGLGGPGPRWHVVAKDHEQNIVYVERNHDHPALYSTTIYCDPIHWIYESEYQKTPFQCHAKIRYRQEDQECTILESQGTQTKVQFKDPQWAAAPGQTIAFYDKHICFASARIRKTEE